MTSVWLGFSNLTLLSFACESPLELKLWVAEFVVLEAVAELVVLPLPNDTCGLSSESEFELRRNARAMPRSMLLKLISKGSLSGSSSSSAWVDVFLDEAGFLWTALGGVYLALGKSSSSSHPSFFNPMVFDSVGREATALSEDDRQSVKTRDLRAGARVCMGFASPSSSSSLDWSGTSADAVRGASCGADGAATLECTPISIPKGGWLSLGGALVALSSELRFWAFCRWDVARAVLFV
mmetsp:Transcript_4493/g.10587  ORF Transcript_4493/g.10587 Transcript_4493/m.10587 type:complete len:238 (+) Transcript_4493:1045-1758(+)